MKEEFNYKEFTQNNPLLKEIDEIPYLYKAIQSGNKKEEMRIRKQLLGSFWDNEDIENALKKYSDKNDLELEKKPYLIPIKWNKKRYNKWIRDMASNGGAKNSFDMAQNAKYEYGLLQWVKQNLTLDEDPLERIQWDIENYI